MYVVSDLYTFDSDEEKAMVTYHSVCDAYSSIFDRLKLKYVKGKNCLPNNVCRREFLIAYVIIYINKKIMLL